MATRNRVPPHDLQAEESLLGAMMLDSEAIASVNGLSAAAFYKPAHGHVFTAIKALHSAGKTTEPVVVADRLRQDGVLDQIGGVPALVEIVARCASTQAAGDLVDIVTRKAAARAQIELGTSLIEAGYVENLGAVDRLLVDLVERINGHAQAPLDLDPDLDEFLASDEPPYDWLIEGLIERHDRVIVTGPEGGGKSTLLRQVAVQAASGLHPFTLEPIEPLQVLLVDTENSTRQARRAFRQLRHVAGDAYQPGRLRVRVIGHAVDLTDPATHRDLAARIDAQHVDLLVIGPLYKLLTDDPLKEMPARAVADSLDRLRSINGSAVLIEAHSPYAEGSRAKRPIRPYGASLWSRWPEFGIYLDPDGGALRHWRGQRDERAWPARLQRSTPWPWAPQDAPTDDEPWHGPTECADAIVALLLDMGLELSCNKLGAELRARGLSYRDQTIRDAAALAHTRGDLTRRNGPRGAWLYSATSPPKADDVLDF